MKVNPLAHSRDLRARTLSCIVVALEHIDGSFSTPTAVNLVPNPAIPVATAPNPQLESPSPPFCLIYPHRRPD
ncbi:hypothetical protein BGX38DRAFT_1206279 [Terfezia claveryi]|nr:hypothetical protein BGX38DRAFT_1206279 [Terfezia claveryi]